MRPMYQPSPTVQLLFWCQREVWINVMCHPVLDSHIIWGLCFRFHHSFYQRPTGPFSNGYRWKRAIFWLYTVTNCVPGARVIGPPPKPQAGLGWGSMKRNLVTFGCRTWELNLLQLYRDRLKGLYVVARILFLLLLTSSAWPCLGPA